VWKFVVLLFNINSGHYKRKAINHKKSRRDGVVNFREKFRPEEIFRKIFKFTKNISK